MSGHNSVPRFPFLSDKDDSPLSLFPQLLPESAREKLPVPSEKVHSTIWPLSGEPFSC